MQFAACSVPAAPVRAHAAHTAEMVNQLLFGETVRVLETVDGQWCRIESLLDGYTGFMHQLQLSACSAEAAFRHSEWVMIPTHTTTAVQTPSGPLAVPFGASLPLWKGTEGQCGEISYTYLGKEAVRPAEDRPSSAVFRERLDRWLNAPYLWGGRTQLGVDCSGLTQLILKTRGVFLPRDAAQQAMEGSLVDFQQEAQLGDLAFFDDAEGRIYHVGLILDPDHILHAYGKVRVDSWDHAGIINGDTGERTHQLRIIKRYLSPI